MNPLGEDIKFQNDPIGIMGVLGSDYAELFNIAFTAQKRFVNGQKNFIQAEALKEALLPFVSAYALALKRAMNDDYHWSIMAMPFHPVEVETMSVLVGMQRFIPHGADIIQKAILSMPIERLAKSLIGEVLGQYIQNTNQEPEE